MPCLACHGRGLHSQTGVHWHAAALHCRPTSEAARSSSPQAASGLASGRHSICQATRDAHISPTCRGRACRMAGRLNEGSAGQHRECGGKSAPCQLMQLQLQVPGTAVPHSVNTSPTCSQQGCCLPPRRLPLAAPAAAAWPAPYQPHARAAAQAPRPGCATGGCAAGDPGGRAAAPAQQDDSMCISILLSAAWVA